MWGYCTDALSWDLGEMSPGRSCTESFECFTGVCEDGRCMGTSAGGICSDIRDCEVGLTCKDGKCKSLQGENGSCQSDD